jgi:gluconokinase
VDEPTRPLRVVVMGVSGSGKSTIGVRLATAVDAEYVEADDAHPPANIEKMSAGEPLTDADRMPWLDRLSEALADRDRVVISCSALKRAYRDRLRRAGDVQFVHLAIPIEVARDRLNLRPGHFMGPSMVDSQFDALEPPMPDEADVHIIDATVTPDEVLAAAIAAVQRHD